MDCANGRIKRSPCDFGSPSYPYPYPSPVGADRELLGTYFEKADRDMQHLVQRSATIETTVERIEQHILQTRSAMSSMSRVLETTCHSLQSAGGCSKEDVSSCLQMHMQPLTMAITNMREPLSAAIINMQEPPTTKFTPRTDSMMKKFEEVLLQQVTYTSTSGEGSMWSARKRVLANSQPVVTPDTIFVDGGRTPKIKDTGTLPQKADPTKDTSISHSLKADFDSFREESKLANKELETSVVEKLSKQIRLVVEALDGLGKPHDALASDLGKSTYHPLESGSQESRYGNAECQNVNEQLPKILEEQKKRGDDLKDLPVQQDSEIKLDEDNSFAAVFMFDKDVEKPLYRVEDKFKTEGWAQSVARSDALATMTTVVVCLNAIWIGIEADHSQTGNLYNEPAWIQVITQFFVIYFVSEWNVRFAAFRKSRDAFNDGWFKFDTFLMITMVLDTWVLLVILKVVQDNMQDAGSTRKVKIPTQPFRVLRLLKLTRMARLMKAFPELVTMVQGLIRSLRAIASTIILVSLMSYIWGIVMHMLMNENEHFNDLIYEQSFLNFRTVFRCMWTLLMNGTFLLDNSSQLMTQMIFNAEAQVFLAGLVFCLYVFLTGVLILNMLIGVLCDLVSEVNQEQRNAQAIAYVKQVLLAKLQEVDYHGDGMIGRLELQKVMHESRPVIKKMGINELFLLQMEEMLYNDTEEHRIPIKTALDLLLMCRSSNTATVETLAGGFGYLTRELAALREQLLGRPVTHSSSQALPSIKRPHELRHLPSGDMNAVVRSASKEHFL